MWKLINNHLHEISSHTQSVDISIRHVNHSFINERGITLKIFNQTFNIGFHKHKKDQCNQCILYHNATDAEKRKRQVEYATHIHNKGLAREIKRQCKEEAEADPKKECVAFDLEKQLECPYRENSLFYYYSKFRVFNLSMYDMALKQGYCLLWDQSIAKKGANEVASCIYRYVQKYCTQDTEDLSLFADN